MDRVLVLLAMAAGFLALSASVLERRAPGTFPLATLLRERFAVGGEGRLIALGLAAGVASVAAPWAVAAGRGWVTTTTAWNPSVTVAVLAVASLAVKIVMAAIEELVFRGAVLPQIARRAGPLAGLAVSALLFAVAHAGRGPLSVEDVAVLTLDGVGFGWLALASGRLWAPTAWHAAKNTCVWALGAGTLQFVPGPLVTQWHGPVAWVGAGGHAGGLDFAATLTVVVLVAIVTRQSFADPVRARPAPARAMR